MMPTLAACAIALAIAISAGSRPSASTPRFFSDDPLARDIDSQDASGAAEWSIELMVDLSINLFGRPGDKSSDVRAGNINTIDEVPDSNWFTNRIGSRPLTVADLARGPLTAAAPSAEPWTIVASKRVGAAPGFTMRDGAGQVWFVSFDAAGSPEAATAAILVANKIFWALGYWQVENHLVTIRRDRIVIGESAEFTPQSGKTRRMVSGDLDAVFARAHRSEDGSYRAVAARALPGRTIGGFKYYGTRPDDPNDIVPHEHRRELRALKVFGAWTNLTDMKAGNTLDTVVTENGRSVVRHYLQDVGSTFGSGAGGPHDYDEGWEYLVDLGLVKKRFFRLGFPVQPWQTVPYEDNYAVGRFEGTQFDPVRWVPRAPTAAFLRARADDNFWAARRVAAFSDDMIRAVVDTGQYSRASDRKLLADVLIQRRDKILKEYLNAVNPLVDFALQSDGRLMFQNAAVRAGVAAPPAGGYRGTWARFDNATGAVSPIGESASSRETVLSSPAGLPSTLGTFVKVSVASAGAERPSWSTPVEVYFRRTAAAWQLVGLDRLTAPTQEPRGPAVQRTH